MDDPELFDLVMGLPPERREAAVREACEGDPRRTALLLELVELAAQAEPPEPATAPEEAEPAEPAGPAGGELVGRYVIVGLLGQGAFGRVYEAFDLELRRRVALKILREDRSATVEENRRFQREAQSLARIDHPNVVRVYDVGEHEGRPYLTMELVEGTSLRPFVEGAAGKGWRYVLDTLLPAARGLQAAHDAGIVHRDFKPENVMLAAGGRIVVTDFGIARVVSAAPSSVSIPTGLAGSSESSATTSTASAIGTPFYMAPEQLLGRATPRSDVYAFCRVLLEALGGRSKRPGLAVLSGEPGQKVLRLELPPIRAPRWLRGVLARGLQPVEEHRYPSMAALLHDVERHRARRRWAVRAAAAVGVGTPLAYALSWSPPPACGQWNEDALQQELHDTWSQLAAAASTTTQPAPAAAQVAAMRTMVEWNVGEWARARTATCEQHVNGILDAATARTRDECFARWHTELRRRLQWTVDNPEALGTVRLTEELPRNPTRCAYLDAPRLAQPELDPEQRDAIDARLAEATDLRIHGDFAASARAAEAALRLAEDVGHAAHRAEIHHRLGVLAARRHEPGLAVELLERSLVAAERLGLDALAAESLASLAETVALHPTWPVTQAEPWLAVAQAKLAHQGERHDELEPELSSIEGHVAHEQGRYVEAEAAYQRAAEQFERIAGPTDPRAAAARANLAAALSAQGRHAEAIELAERALAARESLIGREHPLIADDRLRLGMIHVRAASAAASPDEARAQLAAARTRLEDAARAMERIHGPRSLQRAMALAELTSVRLRLGGIDEGVAHDVREFVLILEDPATRGSTPHAKARALRIARNAYHALRAWPEARRISERLVDLERDRQPPPDLEARDDELVLVSYLLHLDQTDEARQRLDAHSARYTAAYPDDAEYQRKLQQLRHALEAAAPTEQRTTPP